MNLIPPIEMSEAEMRIACPTVTAKTEMAVVGGAIYVRHLNTWVLLDAARHGHAA